MSELAELQSTHIRLLERPEPRDPKRSKRDKVSAKTVKQVAEVFGVSMDWLYAGTGERPSDEAIRAHVAPLVASLERRRQRERERRARARERKTGTGG